MKKFLVILFALSLSLLGCSRDYGSEVIHPIPYGATLLIYGGEKGNVYLGELNTSKYSSESIWNKYGKYGSKYNSDCIWNKYGKYGGKYSSFSPFNDYASYPPVLKDAKGTFYGFFTSNRYKTNRARYELIDIICDNYDEISEDVTEWHDKIFY